MKIKNKIIKQIQYQEIKSIVYIYLIIYISQNIFEIDYIRNFIFIFSYHFLFLLFFDDISFLFRFFKLDLILISCFLFILENMMRLFNHCHDERDVDELSIYKTRFSRLIIQ